jgi:DNA-binding transcriptional ArsR family regulator
VRVKVLEILREPQCAASVARVIGLPRQKINYHLKELARVGLVEHAGERRKGNFIEQLYRATARRFVVSSAIDWDAERLASTLRDQVSLANLADLGERLQQDAAGLLDRAAYDGVQVPSAVIEAEIQFADAAARTEFLEAYLAAIGPLLKKFGQPPDGADADDARRAEPYRVAVAIYPEMQTTVEDSANDQKP